MGIAYNFKAHIFIYFIWGGGGAHSRPIEISRPVSNIRGPTLTIAVPDNFLYAQQRKLFWSTPTTFEGKLYGDLNVAVWIRLETSKEYHTGIAIFSESKIEYLPPIS